MHIAVSKGATPGESFVSYVEFLSSKNYIPPDAKQWVDHIRQKGNEANHEIVVMSRADADDLLSFSEMLLKLVYEFPAAIKRKTERPQMG
jgi:murein tripeptide amidase MpaA